MEISIDDIRKLPPQVQLALAEQIWDDLLHSGQLLTDDQISETCRRSRELDDDPSIGLSEEQMWAKVDERRNGKKPDGVSAHHGAMRGRNSLSRMNIV